jgi:putative DNA primase/helicase
MAAIFARYAGHARRDLIEENKFSPSPKNDIAKLPGVRFLYSEETTDNGKFRTDLIKSIASGEDLTGEHKFCPIFTFPSVSKLWISGNYRPRMDGGDFGFTRRLRLLLFETTITDAEEVSSDVLMRKFRRESSGILNWLIAGLKAFVPGIANTPIECQAATNEYKCSEDNIGEFIIQCTQDATREWRGTTKSVAYRGYTDWCESEGNKFPVSLTTFTRRLKAKGWQMDAGRRYWLEKSIKHKDEWGSDEASQTLE